MKQEPKDTTKRKTQSFPQKGQEKLIKTLLQNELHQLRETMPYFLDFLDRDITPEFLWTKFQKGRKEYGGTFNLNSIDCLKEAKEEYADLLLYFLFYSLQNEG